MIRLKAHYSKSKFFKKLITHSSLVWSMCSSQRRDFILLWSLSEVVNSSCISGRQDNFLSKEQSSIQWLSPLLLVICILRKLFIAILNPKISWWERMATYASQTSVSLKSSSKAKWLSHSAVLLNTLHQKYWTKVAIPSLLIGGLLVSLLMRWL